MVEPIRELGFLDHGSYINTSHIERILTFDIESSEPKGKLSDFFIEKLCKVFLFNML